MSEYIITVFLGLLLVVSAAALPTPSNEFLPRPENVRECVELFNQTISVTK